MLRGGFMAGESGLMRCLRPPGNPRRFLCLFDNGCHTMFPDMSCMPRPKPRGGMARRRLGWLCLTLFIASFGIEAGADDSATWQAGAARRVITPRTPMWMAGYASRNHPAVATSTDLYCKTLFLKDPAGHAGLVITLDLVGISRSLADDWCRWIGKRFGLDRSQIVINVSHTHSGPVVADNLSSLHMWQLEATQREHLRRYAGWLTEQVRSAVAEAVESTEPVHLSWGSGTASFAVNRRNNRPESEVPARRRNGTLKGPQDHDVPVLAVWRGASPSDMAGGSGKPARHQLKAVLFGYACHATVLSWYYWSGDYPGHAQRLLEQRYPGAVALFWAGCGGDQNPLPRRRIELAQQYGMQLADAVDQTLQGELHPVRGTLLTRFTTTELAFAEVPTREQVERERASTNRYVAARARMWLARLDQGESLPATYPYPIGYWRFGDQVEWFTLGGEVVVDYALLMKSERRGKATWVAGYSHDVMAYIPSLRVLREGGYEGGGAMVYCGFFAPWRNDVERTIVDAARKLARTGATKPD